MCLYVDDTLTQEMKDSANPSLVGYKVLRYMRARENFIPDERLVSPYMMEMKWQPGVNKSDRTTTDYPDEHDRLNECELIMEVNRGIHVFLYKEDAQEFVAVALQTHHKLLRICPDNKPTILVIVEVTCQKEHLVAAGTHDNEVLVAAFTEVTLSQEEYDRALKEQACVST